MSKRVGRAERALFLLYARHRTLRLQMRTRTAALAAYVTFLLTLLPPPSTALSNLDKPRSAFLQDVLESKTADQKYCKVRTVSA